MVQAREALFLPSVLLFYGMLEVISEIIKSAECKWRNKMLASKSTVFRAGSSVVV